MDSQQQFCLKWNSFGSNLATAFSNLFKSESLADVTLFCEGTTFKAHKLILAACSKHFADLFETAPPTSGSCYVILEATSAANMSALLEFMYKGEVHVSQEALSSFLKSAESLQVKGLSIEHEKIAVAQSQHVRDTPLGSPIRLKHKLNNNIGHPKDAMDTTAAISQHQSSSFSPVLTPYINPIGYRTQYEQRLVSNMNELPRKRQLRSPINDWHQERGSVLRDGSKTNRTSSPSPSGRAYRPGSSSSCSQVGAVSGSGETEQTSNEKGGGSPHPSRFEDTGNGNGNGNENAERGNESGGGAETTANNSAFDTTAAVSEEREDGRKSVDQGFAEDLRVKIEADFTSGNGGGTAPPTPSSTPSISTSFGTVKVETSLPPHIPPTDLLNTSLWNASKLTGHKAGSVATPDGKKLKCPYCDRLYGYETNLRAHIRQRHQGIRVPCPYCARTFTRNNTAQTSGVLVHRIINGTQENSLLVHKLLLFSMQINHQKAVFSCGLFTFDWTLMYSMIAAGTTYIVILIQLDTPSIS